jgi:hypothetical protein
MSAREFNGRRKHAVCSAGIALVLIAGSTGCGAQVEESAGQAASPIDIPLSSAPVAIVGDSVSADSISVHRSGDTSLLMFTRNGESVPMTDPEEFVVTAVPSPTDSRVAIVRLKGSEMILSIQVVTPTGLRQPSLVIEGVGPGRPLWSPDGTQLAIAMQVVPGGTAVSIVDVASGKVTHRFEPADYVVEPDWGCSSMGPVSLLASDWSPDGSRLVGRASSFCVEVDFVDLVMFETDTGLMREVGDVGDETDNATFSPDGRFVAVSSLEGGVFMVDVDTGVAAAVAPGAFPAWNGITGELAIVQLSDQGTGAAAIAVGLLTDEVLASVDGWVPSEIIDAPGAAPPRWLGNGGELLVQSVKGDVVRTGKNSQVVVHPPAPDILILDYSFIQGV